MCNSIQLCQFELWAYSPSRASHFQWHGFQVNLRLSRYPVWWPSLLPRWWSSFPDESKSMKCGEVFFFPICIFFSCSHMVEFVRWVHLDGEASRGSIATSLAQPHHVWASGVSAAAAGVAPYLVCCATARRGQAWLGFFALGWWGGGHFDKKDSNWHGPKLCVGRWSFFVLIRLIRTREWRHGAVANGTAFLTLKEGCWDGLYPVSWPDSASG